VIEYIPDVGFIINSTKIEWKNDRQNVRTELKLKYRTEDKTIDIAQFFDGDESMNITQKRDVYENVKSKNELLFLNYDNENNLRDLEVHSGYDILIDNIRLEFGKKISDLIKQFQKNGIECTETEKGNYFLPKLKISIADNASMGGKGTELSYFYASSDVGHLTE